jgi:hypothetical protein
MGQLAPTSKTLIDSKQLSVQPVRADKIAPPVGAVVKTRGKTPE